MPTLPTFCGKDCGGNACPLLATFQNGRVTCVANNPAGGKYLKGCSRGFQLPLETYAPDRLLRPIVRNGPRGSGLFRETSWEEALQITAEKLGEIRAKYGPTAVLNRASAGCIGALHGTGPLLSRFLSLFGGFTRSTGSYSNGASRFVLPYLLGDQWRTAGWDAATMQSAEMIILWGANVLETRQGAEVPQRLVEAKKRGAQIVVIDPRRSATVRHAATWWMPCRPGADAALMLAVLHVLITENLANRDFIAAHSSGFDLLERYVLSGTYSPQWAAPVCGVPEEEIIRFARAYAAAKPAMLFPGYSIQRVFAGEETYRLAVALQIATGNFGRRGGSTGVMNNLLPNPRVGHLPVPELAGLPEVPVATWAEAVLSGKEHGHPTGISAIYNLGANLLNQGGEIRRSIAALEKIDFLVSHEVFLTPTARYCDVVFPAAAALEKEDIGLPWHGNYLLYKPRAVTPPGQARSDYDALCDLADRLGFGEAFSEGRGEADWVQHFIDLSEIPDAAAFKQTGIYWAPEQERVGLEDFAADPARFPLSTPSGRVEIASQRYQQETGFPAIPTWRQPPADTRYPLRLVTPKSPHRTHSQGSNIAEIRQKAAHCLEMHPQDAASRGIAAGDWVRVFNDQGATHATARLTGDLIPGVICLPEGVWFELDENGADRAGSANMLTPAAPTLPSQSCIMHGIGVEVQLDL